MVSPNTAHFEEANKAYAQSFTEGDTPVPPARKITVVTCMDARLHPEQFLGLKVGDAHVIRNAGGRTADAVRSVTISQQLLGTREVAVIHHTDCGMEKFENKDLYQLVEKSLGATAAEEAKKTNFLPYKGLEESVRSDIKLLQDSPLVLPETVFHGYVYDVHTGKLLPVSS